MSNPNEPDLIVLSSAYALDAVADTERDDIERRLAAAPPAVVEAFHDELRAVRETMAVMSAQTAEEPPEALRNRILAVVSTDPMRAALSRRASIDRWQRSGLVAVAAALVIGLGAVGVGLALRPTEQPSTAQQVFAAPDVSTVTGDIPSGGTATVVFSRDRDAGVLVMNNVAPPSPGTVYQMWLLGDQGAQSAGTMDSAAVSPSTTAVLPDLDNSTALAFTVEPGSGSAQPTGEFIAQLRLT